MRKIEDKYNESNIKTVLNKDSYKNNKFIPKKSRNFIPKKILYENNMDNKQENNVPIFLEFNNNFIYQYYYTTLNYLKKYNEYSNNIKILINNSISDIKKDIHNEDNSFNGEKTFISNRTKKNQNNNIFINKENIKYIYNKYFYNRNRNNDLNKNLQVKEINKINNYSNKEDNINLNSYFYSNKNINNGEINILINNINNPQFIPSNINNSKDIRNYKISSLLKEDNQNKDKKEKISLFLSEKINKFENTSTKSNEINNNEKEEYFTEMFGKRGWICIFCNNFNYEARIKCNRCRALKNPKKIVNKLKNEKNDQNIQNNNWICSNCKNFNYSFRKICNRCKNPKIYHQINKSIFYENEINKNYFSSNFIIPPFIISNNISNFLINNITNIAYNNDNKNK